MMPNIQTISDRHWEYLVVSDSDLPPDATSPVMDSRQMTRWMNKMDDRGWEFVGSGRKDWNDSWSQNWWVFRRLHRQ